MTDHFTAARNIGMKALRRLTSVHRPFVRVARRRERNQEQRGFAREAARIERALQGIAAGSGPIVAGPFLAEVGYEALYWVPFLRWFVDHHRVAPERLTVVSRGGVRGWYDGIAGSYVDLFDHYSPDELAAHNDARVAREEGGGRKQSAVGTLDREILRRVGLDENGAVLHPSAMFGLFRHVWHGSLPFDFFWTRTRYAMLAAPPVAAFDGLPSTFIAAKFYTGRALPASQQNRAMLRRIVERAAARAPVVILDTGMAVDEHEDYQFTQIPNVISAREWMRPANNLGVQTALIAQAQSFVGTCGGLAWLAPFLGTPAVAVYADDALLVPHLFVARQAGKRVGASDFLPLDLRAAHHTGIVDVL
jgi:hypothetical protein